MTEQFLPPEALSPDGYIIDQGRMSGVRYGRFGSDYNGCGWIAAYNLLRRCGKDMSPEQTRDALGKKLRLGGRFGTFPLALRKFLRRYLPVSLKLCWKSGLLGWPVCRGYCSIGRDEARTTFASRPVSVTDAYCSATRNTGSAATALCRRSSGRDM